MPGKGGTDRSGMAFCHARIKPSVRSRVRCMAWAKAAGSAVRTALCTGPKQREKDTP
jgi:hypothetical protein